MNKNRVVNGIVFDTAKANCMWGTEMYISIKELPEELTDTVNKAVAEKIKEYCVEWKNTMEKHRQKWSDKQILEPQLWVYIPDFTNSGKDKSDRFPNQKNDEYNKFIKLIRHTYTIRYFPFIKVFANDQRIGSINADLFEIFGTVIKLKPVKKIKNSFP